MKTRLLVLALMIPLAACRQQEAPPAAEAPPPPPMAPVADTAPPDAAAAPLVPRAFLCRGNEPFWSLDITADRAWLKTPDAESELAGELVAADGGSFRFTGAPEGSPAESVAVLVTPGQCFDTMADGPASPFNAQASFGGGEPVNGCCTAEMGLDLEAAPVFDAAGKPDTDWSRRLDDLDEAIGRCVRDAGVVTSVVTTAWPMNKGKAGVRLRDPGDARFDCIVDLGSGKIDDVTAVAPDDQMPGEGQPLWLPAGDGAPILDCGRVERVMPGGDEVVGYLHYTDGCG